MSTLQSQFAPSRAVLRGVAFHQDQLLPRVQDKVMARRPLRSVRARVCDGLEGAVVEIGVGTGLTAGYDRLR